MSRDANLSGSKCEFFPISEKLLNVKKFDISIESSADFFLENLYSFQTKRLTVAGVSFVQVEGNIDKIIVYFDDKNALRVARA